MRASVASKVAVAGLALDQLLSWYFTAYQPASVHSNPYFPLFQNIWGWSASALLLGCLASARKDFRPGVWLVGAGLLSNGLSHFAHGGFIDYIPTGFSYINTADILVDAGCILLFAVLLRPGRKLP